MSQTLESAHPADSAVIPAPDGAGRGGTMVVVLLALPLMGLATSAAHRSAHFDKDREPRATVREIARAAGAAYERDGTLCDSAGPVPRRVPKGRKYQSQPSEWDGFACLGFTYQSVQRYAYGYTRTVDGFVVTGRGDLDGDGVLSEFSQAGTIVGDRLVLHALTVEDDFE
jgi:hypothetical protein